MYNLCLVVLFTSDQLMKWDIYIYIYVNHWNIFLKDNFFVQRLKLASWGLTFLEEETLIICYYFITIKFCLNLVFGEHGGHVNFIRQTFPTSRVAGYKKSWGQERMHVSIWAGLEPLCTCEWNKYPKEISITFKWSMFL